MPTRNQSRPGPKQKQTAGFTLLEVMLAVTISAIVFMIAFTVIGALVHTTLRMETYAQPSRSAQQVLARLVTDFESCYIPHSNKLAFYATLDDRRVRFLSTADSQIMPDGRQGDMIEVAYTAQRSGDKWSLYRRETPYIDNRPMEGGEFVLLAMELESFELEFFDGEQWRQQWDNLGTEAFDKKDVGLPKAIKIMLRVDENHEYTTQVIPLRMSFDIQ